MHPAAITLLTFNELIGKASEQQHSAEVQSVRSGKYAMNKGHET